MAAPKENKNAEKWDFETSKSFMDSAIVLSEDEDYDFIGEVAKDLGYDKGVFDYIIEKFPQLKHLKSRIKNNCEVNCFRNSKKGKINTAIGIVNLKSNHGWTDRVEQTHEGGKNPVIVNLGGGLKPDEAT